MSKNDITLNEYKRDKDGISDISKYTVTSHSSDTIVDWDIILEYRPMIQINSVSIDIHSDGFSTKEEAMEQLGRWMIRLGEALMEHNLK